MPFLRAIRPLALGLLVPFALACASRATATVAPAPAPDLSGPWDFDMDVGAQQLTRGAFTLVRRGDGYVGELTTNRGPNLLPVRSFTIARDSVAMIVESPNGLVTFRGLLASGARGMSGTVAYHDGRTFPMTVRRRAAQGSGRS